MTCIKVSERAAENFFLQRQRHGQNTNADLSSCPVQTLFSESEMSEGDVNICSGDQMHLEKGGEEANSREVQF